MDKFIKPRKVKTENGKAEGNATPATHGSPQTLRDRKAAERQVSLAEADSVMERHIKAKNG